MREYFPVTPDQNGLMNYAKIAPPSMLNLCVRVDITDTIDEAIFLKAIETAVERLHYLRFRIHDVDGTAMQYEASMDEHEFEPVFDATNYTDKKLNSLMDKWSGKAFPNNLRDVQLCIIRLIRRNNNKHTLYFSGHHLMMDIYSVVFAITYIGKCYVALRNGKELPREGADPGKDAVERSTYIGSKRYEKDYAWWKEMFSSEPQFTSINGIGSKEFAKNGKWGHERSILQMKAKELRFTIPAELVKAIDKTALEKNSSPYAYYVLAMRTFLGAVCKTDDVTILSPTINRATVAQKSCGLCRAALELMRSNISGDTTFSEACKILDITHKDYLKHQGIPSLRSTIYQSFDIPADGLYDSVTFSYVPFVDYDAVDFNFTAEKIDSGISLSPLYILFVPIDNSGNLQAFYQYAVGYINPENIEKYHSFMLRFLEAGLKNPDKTIAQLTEETM